MALRPRALGEVIVNEGQFSARDYLHYSLLGVFLIALFLRRFVWMAQLWWSDGLYSFSALVPLVSIAIIYAKRKRLRALPIRPSPVGIVVVIAGAAATVLADWLNILHSFTPLFLVIILCGITLTVGGRIILKELLFPES